jgi:outer membrane receptor protein involved in Fe transport
MPYSANVFTYLLTPQLKLSPDVMVYARLASGYRPGGTNCAQSGCTGTEVGATVNYSPDKTDNYELGLKGDFLDHALSLDASAFYIDWTDMQVGAVTANHGGYTSNAGRARSQGLELSAESRPLPGLELSGWIVWNDAHIVSFPSNSTVAAALGDRLPNSSRFSSNLSIDQDFPLSSTVRGFVGGSLAYIGQRAGAFPTVPPSGPAPLQGVNPAYAKVDLRAGIEHESWRVNLSALNVADRRGELTGGGPGAIPPDAIYFIQPRTIWLSVVKTF